MAEKRSEDFSQQLAGIAECPICTDRIQNNRLLPCGHTFCLKCLEQYKKTAKAKGKSLPCPVCRREFGIPKGGCAMFPKNIMVDQLLAVENPIKDGDYVRQCETCETENKTKASVHCIECDQSLCSECEKLHGKLKVSATHHVVPVSENSKFKDIVRRSYCEHHSEYTLELMCYDCNTTICWKCRSLSHSDHRVADMKDLADGYCEQLQSNIEEINARLSVLSKIAGNINDQEQQYQDNFDKEKANVAKTGAELIRTVVANEEKLIKQLLFALHKNIKSIQPHREKVLSQMESLKQLKAFVEQLKESGNSQEIVDKTAELHSKAHQLLALSIISIDEPALSSMTESEIQKHLIGFNVTRPTANGTVGVRRVSSDHGRSSETVNAGSCLSGSMHDQEEMGSIKAIASRLNLAASSRSQINAGTNLKGKPSPPATLKKPEQKRSLSLSNPDQDVTPLNAAKTDPGPGIYKNIPPATPSPPPQLPPRLNLPSTPSASDRTTQSLKEPEQQPPAKDVGLPVTTSTGFSVSSFSVGGGSAVQGVAVYKQKIYVATENNPEISVYSSDEHVFLHALVVPGLKQASDMTFCRRNSCLYLIDWVVRSIFRAEIEGVKEIIDWSTEGEFGGLSASGDGSVVLAGHETNSLKEYTTWGTLIRTVKLKSDVGEVIRPWHAVKLASEKFVVSHGSSSDTALHRVCLVDSGGQIVKSFGGLRGRGNNSLWGPYHLCMTDENRLFIADCNNGRIVVLDENLEFLSEISGSLRKPRRICLDKPSNKLFVTDNRLIAKKAADGRIVIFSQVL